ncbi:hypothetical protein ASPCAL14504 [Aspergillus calidoustus]|uniref:Shugoshin n=1 Tax=Aspergillus calidoustus TaxID=454130 RepID=A0A0U5CK35_ASPCI|nr:hypothetical protein ASPCAL14504 [Aspergillus calidoustus]
MARLNESTASAEPIEILKRRFVRQNREIARVNSIQSLRIRGLESEVSHLLSENVSLREQVITLTQELERFEAAKTLRDGVYDIKTRLDSKLVELGSLVNELGNLPRQYSKTTRERAESELESPTERDSRRPSSVNQVNGADPEPALDVEVDGRLPVILEDKYYPRRTLEARELQQLSNDNWGVSCSLISGDARTSPTHTPEHNASPTVTPAKITDIQPFEEYAVDEHSLPPNLETRRKKKAGSVTMDEDRSTGETISLFDSKFMRKCGAKRKFSAEDGESLFESTPAEDDGFEFTRPNSSPKKLVSKSDQSPVKRRPQSRVGTTGIGQPKRKVLEPKNTNLSITSPARPIRPKNYDKLQNPATPGEIENSYPMQGQNVSQKKGITPVHEDRLSAVFDKHEEKAETQLHQQPLQGVDRDVPAANDISNARPSRRQRAVVSYAEPNLRDKMRRSTNELGPAVGKDNARRSSSQTESARDQRHKDETTQKSRKSGVTVGDPEANDADTLAGNSNRQMGMISHRKPRSLGRTVDETEGDCVKGNSLSGRNDQESVNQSSTSLASVDIAHGKVSFSKESVTSAAMYRAALETSKKSRRHSSNTRTSGRSTTPKFPADYLDEGAESNGSATVHETAKDGPAAGDSQYSDAPFIMESREMTRGQRVAARRRSMML